MNTRAAPPSSPVQAESSRRPEPNDVQYLPSLEQEALRRTFEAMASKVYQKYLEGYDGFENCSAEFLSQLLRQHVEKGDPIDVANFCAFLHANKQRIAPVQEPDGRVWVPCSICGLRVPESSARAAPVQPINAAAPILPAATAAAPINAEPVARRLFESDAFCPSCGHNRDRSSVSSIDHEDGTKSCQVCSAVWVEGDAAPSSAQPTVAAPVQAELPAPVARINNAARLEWLCDHETSVRLIGSSLYAAPPAGMKLTDANTIKRLADDMIEAFRQCLRGDPHSSTKEQNQKQARFGQSRLALHAAIEQALSLEGVREEKR